MDVPQTQLKPLIDLEKEMEKYDDDDIPIQVLKNSPNNVVEKRGKQTEALINTTNKHLKDQIKKGNIKKEDLLLRQDPNGLMVNKNRTIAIRDSFMAKQFNNALGVNDEPMATPEQVGQLAERLERNAQMTGGKGPLSNFKKKPIKKKTEVNYSDFKINPTLPTEFLNLPHHPQNIQNKKENLKEFQLKEKEKKLVDQKDSQEYWDLVKRIMNKYEIKYMLETTMSAVDRLTDTNAKITLHNENLWGEIKQKDEKIGELFAKLQDLAKEKYKLQSIIKSQEEKDLTEYHFPEKVDN